MSWLNNPVMIFALWTWAIIEKLINTHSQEKLLPCLGQNILFKLLLNSKVCKIINIIIIFRRILDSEKVSKVERIVLRVLYSFILFKSLLLKKIRMGELHWLNLMQTPNNIISGNGCDESYGLADFFLVNWFISWFGAVPLLLYRKCLLQ